MHSEETAHYPNNNVHTMESQTMPLPIIGLKDANLA